MARHKRHVPITEHAVLMGNGHDPRTRANHECFTTHDGAFCPVCNPTVYALMASRHAADPADPRRDGRTVLSWP